MFRMKFLITYDFEFEKLMVFVQKSWKYLTSTAEKFPEAFVFDPLVTEYSLGFIKYFLIVMNVVFALNKRVFTKHIFFLLHYSITQLI